MKKIQQVITTFTLLILTSCAHFTHFNDVDTVGENEVLLMDAKQRVMYRTVVKRPATNYKGELLKNNNKPLETILQGYCAEPSPDVMSALASALGVDLTIKEEAKLGLSNSLGESVSNIGVRTAAIQALKDFMYRNCEAYAVGGITAFGLETLQRRFQSTMVSILAIEQLTGAVQSQPITITSHADTGSAESIVKLNEATTGQLKAVNQAKTEEAEAQKQYDAEKKLLEDKETELKSKKEEKEEKETNPDPDPTKQAAAISELDGQIKTLETDKAEKEKAVLSKKEALETAKKVTAINEDTYQSLQNSLSAVKAGVTSAGANVQYASAITSNPGQLDKDTVVALADKVKEIAQLSTGVGNYWTEVCTTLVGHPEHYNKTPNPGSTLAVCNALLTAQTPEQKDELFNETVEEVFEHARISDADLLKSIKGSLLTLGVTGLGEGAEWGDMKEYVEKVFSRCKHLKKNLVISESKLDDVDDFLIDATEDDTVIRKCTLQTQQSSR